MQSVQSHSKPDDSYGTQCCRLLTEKVKPFFKIIFGISVQTVFFFSPGNAIGDA